MNTLSHSHLLSPLLVLGIVVLGCSNDVEPVKSTGPLMRPGDNCLRCHNPDGGVGAPPWTAGGTVFPRLDSRPKEGVEGVSVYLKDQNGTVAVALETNAVGNFYTDQVLPDPFLVEIHYQGQSIEMPCAPPAGSCNACHSSVPVGDAKGRIFLPQNKPEAEGKFNCETWDLGRGSGRQITR